MTMSEIVTALVSFGWKLDADIRSGAPLSDERKKKLRQQAELLQGAYNALPITERLSIADDVAAVNAKVKQVLALGTEHKLIQAVAAKMPWPLWVIVALVATLIAAIIVFAAWGTLAAVGVLAIGILATFWWWTGADDRAKAWSWTKERWVRVRKPFRYRLVRYLAIAGILAGLVWLGYAYNVPGVKTAWDWSYAKASTAVSYVWSGTTTPTTGGNPQQPAPIVARGPSLDDLKKSVLGRDLCKRILAAPGMNQKQLKKLLGACSSDPNDTLALQGVRDSSASFAAALKVAGLDPVITSFQLPEDWLELRAADKSGIDFGLPADGLVREPNEILSDLNSVLRQMKPHFDTWCTNRGVP